MNFGHVYVVWFSHEPGNVTMDPFAMDKIYHWVLKVLCCGNEPGGNDPKKALIAVCDIGPAGKPVGSVAHSATPSAYASSFSTGRQRSPSKTSGMVQQFAPQIASRVSGRVTLTQAWDGTTINYTVEGLQPGLHGLHINESSDFSNGCISAGPIYNPFGCNHGGPTDRDRNVGDLGNIVADKAGKAKGSLKSNLVKLTGPHTVIGRSIIVHADADDLGKGDNSKAGEPGPPKNGFCSLITGNAGARIAGGEIKWAQA